MADETVLTSEPEVVVEEAPLTTGDMFVGDPILETPAAPEFTDDDADDDDDAEAEATPAPLTAAEKKRLAQLVQEDPEYQAEFEQLSAQRALAERADAAAQARWALQQEQVNAAYQKGLAERNAAIGRWNALLAQRSQEDAQLFELGRADPIAAQERREALAQKRAQENQVWGQYEQQWAGYEQGLRAQQQTQQQLIAVQTNMQQGIYRSLERIALEVWPAEVRAKVSGKEYDGEYLDGVTAHLAEASQALIDYGKELGRQEATKRADRQAQRERSRIRLVEPQVDLGVGSAGDTILPTPAQLNAMSWEQRQALKAADPLAYDKIYAAAGRRR